MTIRRARASDLASILLIEKKSFARDAWDLELFLDYLTRSSKSVFLVAIVDRDIAGYALAFQTSGRAEIHSIAVEPARRGGGVALALMRRVIEILRSKGCNRLALNVRLENAAAIQLYRKLGFERTRRVNAYYEDGAPSWRMRAAI